MQWVRLNEVLLMPRAKLKIDLVGTSQDFHLRYLNRSFLFQQKGDRVYAEVWVSLFRPEPIEIFQRGKMFEVINVETTKKNAQASTTLIDYSCAPWHLELSGLENDYVSVGCKMHRSGKIGSEVPQLEIYWTSSSYRLLDLSSPPYVALVTTSEPISFTVTNHQQELKIVTITTKLPHRMPRLRLGFGLGPHQFNSKAEERPERREFTGSYFLYGNLYLAEGISLRAFNAYTKTSAMFNNAGLYYATDIAQLLDKRLTVTTLLGAQILTYDTVRDQRYNEAIYPQGGEFIWHHPFGLKNYRLTGGLFVDLSQAYSYQNN
jgi:hypothetical protein